MSQFDGSLALGKTHDLATTLGCLECTHPSSFPGEARESVAKGKGGG